MSEESYAHKSFSCSFCNENFRSSTAMSGHLILCGNKTDQCPNCRKFIRRAIFAYHFENDCANLDDPIDSNEFRSNSINTRNKNHMPKPTKISETIKCEFCNQRCDQEEYKIHKENCLDDPKNPRNKQRPPSSNRNRSIINKNNNNDDVDLIPCQFCNEPIKSYNFIDHQVACNEQQKLREEQQRRTSRTAPRPIPCQHCHAPYNTIENLRVHQRNCHKDPRHRSYAEVAASNHRPLPSN